MWLSLARFLRILGALKPEARTFLRSIDIINLFVHTPSFCLYSVQDSPKYSECRADRPVVRWRTRDAAVSLSRRIVLSGHLRYARLFDGPGANFRKPTKPPFAQRRIRDCVTPRQQQQFIRRPTGIENIPHAGVGETRDSAAHPRLHFPLTTRVTAFSRPSPRPTVAVAVDSNGSIGVNNTRRGIGLMTQKNAHKMAGLSAERYAPHHSSRPPIQSQHSSSVPSTPFQQPRDLRFRSKSPSPHRGLSNQSPRSVVSELVAQPGPQRCAPVVCKFETGAEFRKRRIPYAEGGENELGPPKKEPKKTLEPNEEDKLSGDMRELRLLPSDESEARRAKLVKKLEKMMNDEWPGSDIRVNVFGSSGNLLSSSDSDVDICVTTPLKKLESMHSLATLLDRSTFGHRTPRAKECFWSTMADAMYQMAWRR